MASAGCVYAIRVLKLQIASSSTRELTPMHSIAGEVRDNKARFFHYVVRLTFDTYYSDSRPDVNDYSECLSVVRHCTPYGSYFCMPPGFGLFASFYLPLVDSTSFLFVMIHDYDSQSP
jgi:hypothetical protein